MKDKVCLITGATAGIGKETALALARMGATVAIVGRSPAKTAAVAEEIRSATGNPHVTYHLADLSAMAEVRRLAGEVNEAYPRLDVLVNNAGGVFKPRQVTVDGYELTFALDHLAYFLLTNLLLEKLKASAPARIVSVSSAAHTPGHLDFRDLMLERKYSAWRAYANAKLANILFTYELDRRLAGTGVTANCLHPGGVATNFGQSAGIGWAWKLIQPFLLTAEQGAETAVYLASSPEVEGVSGKYFAKKQAVRSSRESYDPSVAARLWAVSAELTGQSNSI